MPSTVDPTCLPDYIPSSDPSPPGYQYFDAVCTCFTKSSPYTPTSHAPTRSPVRSGRLSTRSGVEYIHGQSYADNTPPGDKPRHADTEASVGYVETKHRDHDKKQGGKGVRFSSSSSAYECHRESRKVNGKTWTSCLKVTVEVKDVEKEMKQGTKEEKEKREKREKKEKKEKKEKREKKEKETKEKRR